MLLLKRVGVVLVAVGLVAVLALGLRSLTVPSAWAQGQPEGTSPEVHGHGHEGHAHQGPPTGPPETPPLPPAKEAFDNARSQDPAARAYGLTQVSTLYAASRDEAVLKEAEKILREAALHGETATMRQTAVQGLGQKADRNLDVIIRVSLDPDPEVQKGAVQALASAGPSAAADRRLEQLMASADTAVSAAAADALMQRHANRGVEGVGPLIMALGIERGDANGKAALALLRVGRPAVPALMSTLSSDSNPVRRHGAAMVLALLCGGRSERQAALAESGQAEHVVQPRFADPDLRPLAVLRDRLLKDPSPIVREACAQALGYMGSPAGGKALAQALLQDPAPEVRVRAASALIMIPGATALEALKTAAQFDRYPRVRRFAVEALGWVEDPRAAEALIAATRDVDEEVRRLACVQLGRLKVQTALPALTALFQDPSEDVRWSAVMAVDKLRSREAVPALVRAVEDPSVLVSHAAETALQKLGEVRRADSHLRQG